MAILFDNRSGNLYVVNEVSDDVTVINGTTNIVQVKGVPAGSDPVALADDTKDRMLFVADDGEYALAYNLSVISTSSDTPQPTIITLLHPASSLAYSFLQGLLAVGIPDFNYVATYVGSSQVSAGFALNVGYNVSSIVSDVNGSEFVVANGTADHLALIPASTGAVTPTFLEMSEAPSRLSVDPVNGALFAWSGSSRTISSVNLFVMQVKQRSPSLGAEAETLAYDADSDRVFVADWQNDSVSVLNASSFLTAQAPLSLPGTPTSLVDDPATGTIYVAYVGGVAAIDARTGEITARNASLTGNNTQLALNPESDLLWDVNKLVGLEALSVPALRVVDVIGTGVGTANLRGVVLDPTMNELFVANLSSSMVVVVNASTGAILDRGISGVTGLRSLAYDSADQMIYALGSAVWIINPATDSIAAGPIPIAPHLLAWSIVYDPSREFLYVTSIDRLLLPFPGNVTVLDGSSVAASQGSYVSIPVGQNPVDLQPVQLPGSAAPGSSEIWVTNFLSGTLSIIASPPQITFLAATPNPVDIGAPSNILLGFAGGAGASQISYSGLPSGCASADSLTLNCTPQAAGSYPITANIVDSLGSSTSAETVLSVSPGNPTSGGSFVGSEWPGRSGYRGALPCRGDGRYGSLQLFLGLR